MAPEQNMTDWGIIRPATAADDRRVGDLLVEAFTNQYARLLPGYVVPPERLADLRNQAEKRAQASVLVVENAGEIIGTVALFRPGTGRSEAWIAGAADLRLLAIDPAWQGRGLARALMDHAEDLARSWKVPAICLHVRREFTEVARLYQARGYQRDPAGDLDYLPRIFLEAYFLPL